MPAERSARTGGSGPPWTTDPSRDEVQRRINSLYDRAETATGNYNATRKMSGGPRQRVEPRPSASRPADPALDAVTKQWFDRPVPNSARPYRDPAAEQDSRPSGGSPARAIRTTPRARRAAAEHSKRSPAAPWPN